MMAEAPVFSRRDVQDVPLDGRIYRIAPLTFRDRAGLYADLAREGAAGVSLPQRQAALRAALAEIAPDNLPELLAVLDAVAEGAAEGDTPEAQAMAARMQVIERAALAHPAYAGIVAQVEMRLALIPAMTLRRALVGWSGEGLPEFRRARGQVPDDLLDLLPQEDLATAGWIAWNLAHLGPVLEKNSAAPSPSTVIPMVLPAG